MSFYIKCTGRSTVMADDVENKNVKTKNCPLILFDTGLENFTRPIAGTSGLGCGTSGNLCICNGFLFLYQS